MSMSHSEGCNGNKRAGVDEPASPFHLYDGGGVVGGAVLVSVPHAGRDYSPEILARSRLSQERLRLLEDRYADVLVEPLVEAGKTVLIARTPRAVIDLNRDERDIDPLMVHGIPYGAPLMQSIKQRGGLGLFPRSLPATGDLWRGAMSWEEAQARVADVHQPYHATLAGLIERVWAVHGTALLLDVHTMPPLISRHYAGEVADIVIGDRFGGSCSSRLSGIAQDVVAQHGFRCALNHPYAGSYLIERHGNPTKGRHALQIEISRALYLDAAFDCLSSGVGQIQTLLTELVQVLEQELTNRPFAQAAE